MAHDPETTRVLASGHFVRLVRKGTWEWAERTRATGIAVLVAVTDAGALLLVEQFRPPLGARVIELPAGLAGDLPGAELEALERAAARELEEETGYRPARVERLTTGPVSAGLTSEVLTFYRATGLARVGAGGGVDGEDITVHEVPLGEVEAWLAARARDGVMADPKIFAGLWFARR